MAQIAALEAVIGDAAAVAESSSQEQMLVVAPQCVGWIQGLVGTRVAVVKTELKDLSCQGRHRVEVAAESKVD